MLPNAIIIGSQKCATTSLHWYLGEHPEVEVATRKPLGFFVSAEDSTHGNLPMTWERGVDWYAANCPDKGRIRLESSPDYTNFPRYKGVPERMKAVVPGARLIYIVRNPIERLVSHYLHNYTGNLEHRPIDKACLDMENSTYIARGLYAMQLEQILQHFDQRQVLIVTREGLLIRRRETLAQAFRFLGVEETFWTDAFETVRHRSADKRRNNAVGMAIDRLVGRRILNRLQGRQRYLFRRLVYTPFSSPVPRPVLDRDLSERLHDIFRPDLERLTRITGQPFENLLGGSPECAALIYNPA
jgi:hypothetical protein